MVSLQRTFVLTGVGSAYAYILQLAIQHVEEVCLRVLTLSCQMLISMAGLIEGIFAFVFFILFSFIISISYFRLPVHYFSTLFIIYYFNTLKKNYESSGS